MSIESPMEALAASWVSDDAALVLACRQWQQASTLYLDTEFIRETTLYPIAALIQVHDGHSAWLVDPVPIRDWAPLAAILQDAVITKVFHACQEDVELLSRLTGVAPQAIMDSQLAAAFCGLGWSIGYRALTEKLCGQSLPDDQHITRSNWLQRPLSDEQEAYAINDVRYLSQAWPRLVACLQEKHWYEACRQETAMRVQQMLTDVDPEQRWQSLGGLERLSARERCIARRLVLWREQAARQGNIARNRLLRDAAILAIARLKPINKAQLAAIEDIRPSSLRHYGDAILAAVATGQVDDPALAPMPPGVGIERMKSLMPCLKARVTAVAQARNLPEALLASRSMLSDWLVAYDNGLPMPPWATGWRREVLVNSLECVMETADASDDTV